MAHGCGALGYYRCPTCSATKEIAARPGQRLEPGDLPASVPCGWRGCEDRAVPTWLVDTATSGEDQS